MDANQAERVATKTLSISGIERDGVPGSAIRFGKYSNAVAYAWTPEGRSLRMALEAFRGQLANSIKDWELIQGGRHVALGGNSGTGSDIAGGLRVFLAEQEPKTPANCDVPAISS
jgi:hypothetical protein